MTIPVVIFARKNFYLVDAISEKILMFQAAGLIEYWHSLSVDKTFLKTQISKKPETLTLNHLFGSFSLLLGGLSIAFVILLIEVIFKVFQTKLMQ